MEKSRWVEIAAITGAVTAVISINLVATGVMISSLSNEIGGIREETRGMRQEMRGEIEGMRQEMRGEIEGLREEMLGEIGGLKEEMLGEIGGLKEEMRAGHQELRLEMAADRQRFQDHAVQSEARLTRIETLLEEHIRAHGSALESAAR